MFADIRDNYRCLRCDGSLTVLDFIELFYKDSIFKTYYTYDSDSGDGGEQIPIMQHKKGNKQ